MVISQLGGGDADSKAFSAFPEKDQIKTTEDIFDIGISRSVPRTRLTSARVEEAPHQVSSWPAETITPTVRGACVSARCRIRGFIDGCHIDRFQKREDDLGQVKATASLADRRCQ